MRVRGVHHVEFAVLDYERSIAFYDRMFGWLGYLYCPGFAESLTN